MALQSCQANKRMPEVLSEDTTDMCQALRYVFLFAVSFSSVAYCATGTTAPVAGSDASLSREPVIGLGHLIPNARLFWTSRIRLLDDQSYNFLNSLDDKLKWESLQVGFPVEPELRLSVDTGLGSERIVCWPGDLKGLAAIGNETDALQFLRLFSSEDTWYRFPQYGYVELTTAAQEDAPRLGKISRGAIDLPKTRVVRTPGGYRVLRSLAKPLPNRIVIVEIVDELLTQDGGYSIMTLWRKETTAQQIGLRLPTFK